MSFVLSSSHQEAPSADAICIASRPDKVLVCDTPNGPRFPLFSEVPKEWAHAATLTELGLLDGIACWSLSPGEETAFQPPLRWSEPRPLANLLPAASLHALASTRELLWWSSRHRFCGCCGSPLENSPTERARTCPSCKAVFYPVIAPAVIVAITRGEELLLAHNRNFRPSLFSLIAGFVDAGETLEQCVRREALEEIGIEVGKLRYITSQPWPYPNSLMLGFTAEWKAGEIQVDGVEIEEAHWYRKEALPEIPAPGTVARHLIDLWLSGKL